MVERDGHVTVVSEVPMEECPACGERWLTMEVAGELDVMLGKLINSGAETATGHWDALLSQVA